MNGRKNIKESIKSALIVVLTLSTTLLLFVFWGEIPLSDLSLSNFDFSFYEEEDVVPTDMYEVLQPTHMLTSMGEGEYIVEKDVLKSYGTPKSGEGLLPALLTALKGEDLYFEEITEEQYRTACDLRSYRGIFDYYLPMTSYCEELGFQKAEWMDSVGELAEIGFSEAAPDSILIKSRNEDKYFRIVTATDRNFLEEYFANLDLSNATYYYPLSAYMGEGVDNETLLPVYLEVDMPLGTAEYNSGSDASEEQAKAYFGNTFDFVRKIQESSGKVIYMYGYGETVLILGADGSIEYKSEVPGNDSLGYCEALKTALRFADNHPNITTYGGVELSLRLAEAKMTNDNHKTYRFEFDTYAQGHRIFERAGHPVIVEVAGGNVTYYYNRQPYVTFDDGGYIKGSYPAINVLATHIPDMAAYVSDMDYGYLYVDGELLPVWQVIVSGWKEPLYFDLFTADIYGLD